MFATWWRCPHYVPSQPFSLSHNDVCLVSHPDAHSRNRLTPLMSRQIIVYFNTKHAPQLQVLH